MKHLQPLVASEDYVCVAVYCLDTISSFKKKCDSFSKIQRARHSRPTQGPKQKKPKPSLQICTTVSRIAEVSGL